VRSAARGWPRRSLHSLHGLSWQCFFSGNTTGTALTRDHAARVRRLTRRVILVPDGDSAGESAAILHATSDMHDASTSLHPATADMHGVTGKLQATTAKSQQAAKGRGVRRRRGYFRSL